MTAEDEARALLQELQAAVTDRDLDRLVSVFSDDPVVFGTNSTNLGVDELQTYAAGVLAAEHTPVWSWDTVIVLEESDDRVLFTVIGRTGVGAALSEPFRLSALAVRRPGREADWRLRHFHGSVPEPLY
ncbi:nuclear transport factor 2 family protein [Nocardioides anomalus]|uniref:Nuclear transport factor 2 family protein n=1 Tax=Nocardioides anomalus TaxID=2712223 RepID=A0A6G6WCX7_9ACTN|nr:nuclear transport factor 2 family protein [Nocardioides anomalus]QIG43007.1 nuclear transport factor 2 family protein [Nocardioides anomalus]